MWPSRSALAEVEVFRMLDRLGFAAPSVDPARLVRRREAAYRLLEGLEVVEVSRSILARAAQPLPTALGTLDAIHLVSALAYRETVEPLRFATHDEALGAAARASGFEVVGC